MAKASNAQILNAAQALRIARADRDAAFDADMAAERQLSLKRVARDEARRIADQAQREFDRLLELRDYSDEQA